MLGVTKREKLTRTVKFLIKSKTIGKGSAFAPFLEAISSGHEELVQAFIASGADPLKWYSIDEGFNGTAIDCAVSHYRNKKSIVKMLLETASHNDKSKLGRFLRNDKNMEAIFKLLVRCAES